MRNGGTAVWQGFDFNWIRTPHRLNHLASWLDDLQAGEDGHRGRCRMRLGVGRVPDQGLGRTFVAGMSSGDLHFIEGEVEAEIGAGVGQAALLELKPVLVPLGGADPEASTVILRGFDLVCTSHPAGVHPQGLGVRLKRIMAEAGYLAFTPELYLHANNSPDWFTHWRGGYAYRMRALYTVVLGDRGAARHTAGVSDHPCVSLSHARRHPGRVPQIVHGAEGFEAAALGIRGFRLDLVHRGRWRRDGRFLRRFKVHVGHTTYEPATGRMQWSPHAWFSNAGAVAYPVRAEHRLWTTLLQVRDPRPVPRDVVVHRFGSGLGDDAHAEAPFHLPVI